MKNNAEYWRDWEVHVFGYGYGSGEEHIIPLLQKFLAAVPEDGTYDYKDLEVAVGSEQAWLLINILCQFDIIEYGTSPRFGWLTPNGKKLQEFMRAHTVDELVEMTNCTEDYAPCYPDYCNCGDGSCNNPFWFKR